MAPGRRRQSGAVPGDSLSRQEQSALRRFTLAEGALMLSLGTLALIFPLVASVWLTAVVALVFLVAGVVSWITTLARACHPSGPHAFGRFVVATLLVLTLLWPWRQGWCLCWRGLVNGMGHPDDWGLDPDVETVPTPLDAGPSRGDQLSLQRPGSARLPCPFPPRGQRGSTLMERPQPVMGSSRALDRQGWGLARCAQTPGTLKPR